MTSDNQKNKITFKNVFNFLISIALAAIFLYIAFYKVDFSTVWNHVVKANLFWVVIFVLLVLFGHFIRALRWRYILISVKPDVKVKNLFGALMVGYGVNAVTPKLGEISRAVVLGRWEGLSRSSMLGTVILERLIDIISLGIAIIIAVFISAQSLYDSFPWLETTLYYTAIIISGFLFGLYFAIVCKEKFYQIITGVIGKLSSRLAESVGHIFNRITEGFGSLKGSKNYLLTISLTIFLMLIYGLTSFIGLYMLDMQYSGEINFGVGWVIMSISAIGVAIPTPGATGSYHALAKSTLVLIYGFDEALSLAYAFLTHILSYSIAIVGSIVSFLILNKFSKNYNQEIQPENNSQ